MQALRLPFGITVGGVEGVSSLAELRSELKVTPPPPPHLSEREREREREGGRERERESECVCVREWVSECDRVCVCLRVGGRMRGYPDT